MNILKILVNKYIDKYLSNIFSDEYISTQGWDHRTIAQRVAAVIVGL